MALYYPQANQKRPLILVGPPSIGRHELRLRLLEDKNRFAAAVPRTLFLYIISVTIVVEFEGTEVIYHIFLPMGLLYFVD